MFVTLNLSGLLVVILRWTFLVLCWFLKKKHAVNRLNESLSNKDFESHFVSDGHSVC